MLAEPCAAMTLMKSLAASGLAVCFVFSSLLLIYMHYNSVQDVPGYSMVSTSGSPGQRALDLAQENGSVVTNNHTQLSFFRRYIKAALVTQEEEEPHVVINKTLEDDRTEMWNPQLYNDYTGEEAPYGFQPILTKVERTLLYIILGDFDRDMRKANLTYFLAGGTLLGSYRHHGIIPWDDDADVYLLSSEKAEAKKVLASISPSYQLIVTDTRWKLFLNSSKRVQNHPWKFPFLDICFIKVSPSKVWDEDPTFTVPFTYPYDAVFPLVKRPFGPLMLYAPRDTPSVLLKTYSIDSCQTLHYSHQYERNIFLWKAKKCKDLYNVFPFVHMTVEAEGVNETLRIGDRVIGWFYHPVYPSVSILESPLAGTYTYLLYFLLIGIAVVGAHVAWRTI